MATLIVGAGFAGLAAALELQQRGEDFVLPETPIGSVQATLDAVHSTPAEPTSAPASEPRATP